MPQITLYLDDATLALVDQAAPACGMSTSRWVVEAVRQYAQHSWPPAVLALAGRFPDFPLRPEAGFEPDAGDVPRLNC